jgi:hypothetical protein
MQKIGFAEALDLIVATNKRYSRSLPDLFWDDT